MVIIGGLYITSLFSTVIGRSHCWIRFFSSLKIKTYAISLNTHTYADTFLIHFSYTRQAKLVRYFRCFLDEIDEKKQGWLSDYYK